MASVMVFVLGFLYRLRSRPSCHRPGRARRRRELRSWCFICHAHRPEGRQSRSARGRWGRAGMSQSAAKLAHNLGLLFGGLHLPVGAVVSLLQPMRSDKSLHLQQCVTLE